ncbi:MAG: dihydropteroate synthase [Deltaproteobacteria bacterium]|nr:dihydropteroate synthase [Deltaproteobacteria bacterium]
MSIKLVGILNVTPDSFSDGGLYLDPAKAIKHAKQLVDEGADLIDIGGQSTRPGSSAISADEEWKRIKDVVKEVVKFSPVSVDTYSAQVAASAIEAGATVINDVTSGFDPEMFSVVSKSDAKLVLMYSGCVKPHDFSHLAESEPLDVMQVVINGLSSAIERALSCGVQRSQLILDPSMGAFVSSHTSDSWEIIHRFSELRELGLPLMFASSRKGFLKLNEEKAPSERDTLSALTACIAAAQFGFSGPDYIRAHNVLLHRTFLEQTSQAK